MKKQQQILEVEVKTKTKPKQKTKKTNQPSNFSIFCHGKKKCRGNYMKINFALALPQQYFC